jgi:hypothetical protein
MFSVLLFSVCGECILNLKKELFSQEQAKSELLNQSMQNALINHIGNGIGGIGNGE